MTRERETTVRGGGGSELRIALLVLDGGLFTEERTKRDETG